MPTAITTTLSSLPFCCFYSTQSLSNLSLLSENSLADTKILMFLAARVKKSSKASDIKFKIRCHRFLYTLVLKDADKADKLKQSLPPCMFYAPLVCFPGLV